MTEPQATPWSTLLPADAGANASVLPQKRVGEHHDGQFGVYMSHKIQKLRRQNASVVQAAKTTKQLFRGVHIYVDGYTVPSKEELRQYVLMHGGGFEHYETARVTHVIATHLPVSKVRQLRFDHSVACIEPSFHLSP